MAKINNVTKLKDMLKEKDSVTIWFPIIERKELYENFLVEIYDLIEAYFEPLKFGLSKYAIVDFLESEENDLVKYLQIKRYIAEEKDFIDLFYNYANQYSIFSKNYYICYKLNVKRDINNHADYIKSILMSIINGNPIDVEEIRMPFIQ